MKDPAQYARTIEAYLCQKNGGHLIRVVGPAFEMVRGWAVSGVPLKVALRGIDRCCERQRTKPGRRRFVRIEFCEADVLDAFDEWRRAVGVGLSGATGPADEPRPARRSALAAHIDRAIARLANVRGVAAASTDLEHEIDGVIRALEGMAAEASKARGEARAAIVSELSRLDARLMNAAIAHVAPSDAERFRQEAAEELAPFGARMPPDERARAEEAAFRRLVRESIRLPNLAYE